MASNVILPDGDLVEKEQDQYEDSQKIDENLEALLKEIAEKTNHQFLKELTPNLPKEENGNEIISEK